MPPLPQYPWPKTPIEPPLYVLPPLSCDCHVHISGPQSSFPLSAKRDYTPNDITVEHLMSLMQSVGMDRAVLVQAAPFGTDNSLMLHALRLYPRILRGVAIVSADVEDSTLDHMHQVGVRGCRISNQAMPSSLRPNGGSGFEHLGSMAARMADRQWHLLIHSGTAAGIASLAPTLKTLPCPVVLDHLCRISPANTADTDTWHTLYNLLDCGHVWLKLSCVYRLSAQSYPHEDMLDLIRNIVTRFPQRLLWGSNWPHPIYTGCMPDDGKLVDLIAQWVEDARYRQMMLVDNPQQLYDFPLA